jgi:hypothetical protein
MIEKGTTCNSKDELIEILERWLEDPKNITIGDLDNYTKNTEWLYLHIGNQSYFFNADTRRDGIKELVKNHKNNNIWKVIQNNRGTYKKLTNDVNQKAIPYLYFYTNEIGEREI